VTQAVVDTNSELFKASKAANAKLFEKLPIGPRHRMYVLQNHKFPRVYASEDKQVAGTIVTSK